MTSPVPSNWPLALPEYIAERYKVLRQLGAGGMGEAYLADDMLLHRHVVIKRMSASLAHNEQDRKRFLSEAKRAAAINHPHVVQIYDVIAEQGELLLVLEYVDGTSLRSLPHGPLPFEQFFPMALQIAEGVAAAHAANVVHCDLKPENILITRSNEIKVLDFGLSRPSSQAEAATVSLSQPKFAGTPGYMAPEMIREQEVDERADIFALGVIYYELLTGISPFRCSTLLDTFHKTVNDEPKPLAEVNPAVPAELDWILSKMLAKSRDERYPTVREIITDLTACQRKSPGGADSTRRSTKTRIVPPNRGRYAWLAAAVLAVLMAAGGYFAYKKLPPRKPPAVHYQSVAVVPFQLIGDSSHELQATAEGMCVALTSKLARIADDHELQVTPASEVRRLSLTNAAAAKQQLGVDLVIEGHLQKMGNTVRITYDLVDTHSMRQLRSDGVQGSITDPFTLEDSMVDGALNLLNVQLEADERQSLGERGTTNAAAYDLFLKGSGYLREYADAANVERAIESFHGALLEDSHYAQADAALGRAYWKKYELTHDPALVDQAQASCESAVQKNAALPDSHLCLGIVAAGRGQYELAVKELETVVQAEPTNDVALVALAGVYQQTNRPADAERVFKRGIAAQPHYWAGYSNLGRFYSDEARYDAAAEQFQLAIAQSPGNWRLYYSLGGVYIYQGKYDLAIENLKKSVNLRPSADGYRNLGQAYLHTRNFEEAISAFRQAIALGSRGYAYYSALADAYYWSHTHPMEAALAYRQSNKLALEQQRINSRDTEANIMLAYNSAALGDESHALEYLKRARDEAPTNAEIMFFAARIYARLHRPSDAAAWLLKAIENNYSKADIRGCPDLDALMTDPAIKTAMAR